MSKTHYNKLFLSDIHLGSLQAQPQKVLDLLERVTADEIYLVGDIIDIMAMKKFFRWESEYNKIIRKLLKLNKNGTRIYYVAGNHDAQLKDYDGDNFSGIEFCIEKKIETISGKTYMVLHGDEFDGIFRSKMLYTLGDILFGITVMLNRINNKIRQKMGYSSWSLSLYLKEKVKKRLKFLSNFEKLVATKAVDNNSDGVICGHVHIPEDKVLNEHNREIHYVNTGCMTEFISYAVETEFGDIKMIHEKESE